jgi:hypothetical protein
VPLLSRPVLEDDKEKRQRCKKHRVCTEGETVGCRTEKSEGLCQTISQLDKSVTGVRRKNVRPPQQEIALKGQRHEEELVHFAHETRTKIFKDSNGQSLGMYIRKIVAGGHLGQGDEIALRMFVDRGVAKINVLVALADNTTLREIDGGLIVLIDDNRTGNR